MTTPTVAVTSTLAMVRAAEAHGVSVGRVLTRAGLSIGMLLDPDARIPVHVSLAIWEELRDQSRNPALQLVAPMALPAGAYRMLDYLVGASATVGEGVNRFARFFSLVNPHVVLTVKMHDRGSDLVAAMATGEAVPAVYVDYIFAALVGRIRAYFRPQLHLAGVDLRQAAPADTRPYREAFGVDVHFGAGADRLRFSKDEWRTPFETADPTLALVLEARARVRLERTTGGARPVDIELRRAIVGALPAGAQVDEVARALHMSVRTLQRKLAESGTSYRAVLDTLRSGLAREYLADDTVSICEVALLLGFSDQRSFHRAFERWTGEAPGRWRARQQTPDRTTPTRPRRRSR
jgi:AraC-like DNA-binding protein